MAPSSVNDLMNMRPEINKKGHRCQMIDCLKFDSDFDTYAEVVYNWRHKLICPLA